MSIIKNIIAMVFTMFFMIASSQITYAKSYTIDEVQIKGWVNPNGDLLVNELFTYTFEGAFTKLSRSFPEAHQAEVEGFSAYLVNDSQPVVGEITEDLLHPLDVTENDITRTAHINEEDEKVSVLYTYTMLGAVKSYKTYSELGITFFETGTNHDTDFENVSISYVLPGDVGKANIHGFMYDRIGKVADIYQDGVVFTTPKSQARSLTATHLLFPSNIMTEQEKEKSSLSFEEAIVKEEKRYDAYKEDLTRMPILEGIIKVSIYLMLAAMGIILLVRQRLFPLFGHTRTILQTDLVYLSFINQNGKHHSKSFLTGVFSLAEKEYVTVTIEPSLERFEHHPATPKETLSFQLKHSIGSLLMYEKSLVSWLFKGKSTSKKLHLHEFAGMAKGEEDHKEFYKDKQGEFEKKHLAWHDEVTELMEEAGTFSSKYSKVIKWSILGIIILLLTLSLYVDNRSVWIVVLPLVFAILFLPQLISNMKKRVPVYFYFVILYFSTMQMVDGSLRTAVLLLLSVGLLLYFSIPPFILTSYNAFYVKRSIVKFNKAIKRGMPTDLSPEDEKRWLARAYLLNNKMPRISNIQLQSSVLASVLAMQTDPFKFVESTWLSSKAFSVSGGNITDSTYSGGGDSGGGSSGGGGGAGAS